VGLKSRNPIELYRSSPTVVPSGEIDARVLAAARRSRASAPVRNQWLVAGAMAAAVAAAFYLRIDTTPSSHYDASNFGDEEGLARDWLINSDLQQPTGPGSQEGLP